MKKSLSVLSMFFLFAAIHAGNAEAKKEKAVRKPAPKEQRVSGAASPMPMPRLSGTASPAPHVSGR